MKPNSRPRADRLRLVLLTTVAFGYVPIAALSSVAAPASAQSTGSGQVTTVPIPSRRPMPPPPAQVPVTPLRPVPTVPSAQAPVRLNPTGRDIALSAPLQDGAFVLGEIDFVIHADDTIDVNASRLIALLRPLIDPTRIAALETDLGSLGQVPIARLSAQGLVVSYDPDNISLAIAIPPEARTARQIRLSNLGDEVIGDVDRPANFAGYVNLRSSFDYVWKGQNKGVQDPLILLDSAFFHRNFVLENEGSVQIGTGAQANTVFRREGTRLVYDDAKRVARWTVGDLQPIARGFSGAPQLAGISLARSYSVLEPQRNVQPRGERSFTVVRPSTVTAFINGQQVQELRLQPGSYNVRDFPFAQGANDVRLVITDDAGRQEVIAFSLFFDRTLLAPGLTEFGLYAGVRAPFAQSSRDYRFNQPGASGFIRRGINERLTLGANFQAQKRGVVGGLEGVIATALGTLGGDVAVSHVSGIGSGYAINVGLQRNFGGRGSTGRAFAFTAERRSKNFATPNDVSSDNRYAYELGATYSQSLGELQFVSVSGNYSKGRAGFTDEKSARVTYGYRFSPRINFAVEGVYEDRQAARRNYGIRATITFRLDARSTASAEYDSRNDRARIGYQTSRGEGVGAVSASANVDYANGAVGGDGSVSYTANRAEVGVSHTSVFNVAGNAIADQRTSVRVGTAIAFADGSFALSRPIFDSFAMVKSHKSLDGKQVYVNPSQGGHYTARSGALGPAVEPDLSSYSDRVITYDVPNAPAGYDLGAGNVRVYPPYRSGYLVVAGSDYSVTALGVLLDQNGAPVSLLAGSATEVGRSDAKPIQIFTTRTGRFGIQGLRPGKWRIDMPTEPPGSVVIDIPAGSDSAVRLGELKLGAPSK